MSRARGCFPTHRTSRVRIRPTFCSCPRHMTSQDEDCGFLYSLLYVCVCMLSHLVMSDSLLPQELQPSRLLCPWDCPGKNTGVGCYFLLQRIFPTQGSNPGSHTAGGWILYHLSHQGSPRILQWVAYPFSWGSSQPRN